jgi:hypothetical protein
MSDPLKGAVRAAVLRLLEPLMKLLLVNVHPTLIRKMHRKLTRSGRRFLLLDSL